MKCRILHSDVKLDNILVNDSGVICKLADFGSASSVEENDITPYLVSRFYRSPEVILGLRYDFGVDIFSVGACLYELYTGHILFPGISNNAMLRLFQEIRGAFPRKLLRKAQFASQHFDEHFNFQEEMVNNATGEVLVRMRNFTEKPTRDMKAEILSCCGAADEKAQVLQFCDLLDKCMVLDPKKRITPEEALRHPFFRA